MDEYIKRSEVIDLVEKAIKKCSTEKTTKGVLVCAHLRTAVMGLRSADVAPRVELAREIFAEIKEKGCFSDPCVQHIVLSFDELAEIEKKYTRAEPEPPKSKQPKCSENFEKKRLLAGDCFHGEIWYRCPYCLAGIEAHSIPKDRICHKCGKAYL